MTTVKAYFIWLHMGLFNFNEEKTYTAKNLESALNMMNSHILHRYNNEFYLHKLIVDVEENDAVPKISN